MTAGGRRTTQKPRSRAKGARSRRPRPRGGRIPRDFYWVFWELNPRTLDVRRHRRYILARILEFGRMVEVRWLLRTYGMEGIHRFLRDEGHPELSARTLCFWRAVLNAKEERWVEPPDFRKHSAALWPD